MLKMVEDMLSLSLRIRAFEFIENFWAESMKSEGVSSFLLCGNFFYVQFKKNESLAANVDRSIKLYIFRK